MYLTPFQMIVGRSKKTVADKWEQIITDHKPIRLTQKIIDPGNTGSSIAAGYFDQPVHAFDKYFIIT